MDRYRRSPSRKCTSASLRWPTSIFSRRSQNANTTMMREMPRTTSTTILRIVSRSIPVVTCTAINLELIDALSCAKIEAGVFSRMPKKDWLIRADAKRKPWNSQFDGSCSPQIANAPKAPVGQGNAGRFVPHQPTSSSIALSRGSNSASRKGFSKAPTTWAPLNCPSFTAAPTFPWSMPLITMTALVFRLAPNH